MIFETRVSVGIGGWKAHAIVQLPFVPTVGQELVIKDITITCERVAYDVKSTRVYVEETRRFSSQEHADEIQKIWGKV